jgi:hypothetical protein
MYAWANGNNTKYTKMAALFWVFIAVSTAGTYLVYRCWIPAAQPSWFDEPSDCRCIIAGARLPDGRKNEIPPHRSRAIENGSLRVAFGIDNAFTTSDSDNVKQHVGEAANLLILDQAQWDATFCMARQTIQRWLEHRPPKIRFNLTSLVRIVSLRVMIGVFFDIGKDVKECELLGLAECINRTWIDSKDETTLVAFENNHELRHYLSAVFPGQSISEQQNPLNWILPGFETLWRVVLRALIETRFKSGQRHPEWQQIMVAFAERPTMEQFRGISAADGIYAEDIVNEAIRLYPPTRRVHRQFQIDGSSRSVAADIEACHRRVDIWGPDALQFNPARWKKPTRQQKDAFLPFRASPFACPAKPTFGPRMIGLLVGAVLGQLGGVWRLELMQGESIQHIEAGKPLGSERDAYEQLFLVSLTSSQTEQLRNGISESGGG